VICEPGGHPISNRRADTYKPCLARGVAPRATYESDECSFGRGKRGKYGPRPSPVALAVTDSALSGISGLSRSSGLRPLRRRVTAYTLRSPRGSQAGESNIMHMPFAASRRPSDVRGAEAVQWPSRGRAVAKPLARAIGALVGALSHGVQRGGQLPAGARHASQWRGDEARMAMGREPQLLASAVRRFGR